jgi:hypothetical protein
MIERVSTPGHRSAADADGWEGSSGVAALAAAPTRRDRLLANYAQAVDPSRLPGQTVSGRPSGSARVGPRCGQLWWSALTDLASSSRSHQAMRAASAAACLTWKARVWHATRTTPRHAMGSQRLRPGHIAISSAWSDGASASLKSGRSAVRPRP